MVRVVLTGRLTTSRSPRISCRCKSSRFVCFKYLRIKVSQSKHIIGIEHLDVFAVDNKIVDKEVDTDRCRKLVIKGVVVKPSDQT